MAYTTTSTFLHWLQRKRYQYEVTFSLYMLTPTEKFIFNSFIFLFLSMIIIAASLYLPEHITTMLSRAWFYYAGDEVGGGGAQGVKAQAHAQVHGQGQGQGRRGMPGEDVIEMLGRL